MIKEHDQQAKMKATPRKLAYDDSEKEALVGALVKGFFDRFSLESSGTSDTHRQTRSTIKSQKTPSKNKELTHLRRSRRLEDRSTTKEKARIEMCKSRRKRSGHQETSLDSEYEEGSDDAFECQNSPYKRPKPTPFTQRITHFKYLKRAKLPRYIRVYEGNKDPEDHLGGAARNLFDDLDPKSVDSFEELSQKFLEEFSQQKRYAKDPTKIHGIKRRQNKGLQAFMDQFKSESSHIKGVPLVLRISAFMHSHSHPELAKKLNDKIPKTVDEMFERVGAFIRGEVAAGSAEMDRPSHGDKGYVRPAWVGGLEKARNKGGPKEARRNMRVYTPYPRKDTFTTLTKTPKEILAMESVSFPKPPPLIGTPEKQNLNKFCDYHGDRGHNTNDCYQLKKQIKEVVALEKLAHLVKDIARKLFSGMGTGRTGFENALGAVGSTIHSMIKFPTNQGVITMEISIEALRECKHLERVQGSRKESKEGIEEVFIISQERSDQYVTMGATLTTNCKQLLADVVRENIEVLAWTGSERKIVPRFVMEHKLKIYPLVEPVVHKRRPVAPKGRLALKEKVSRWLGEGLIRKVLHPEWIANAIPIKLTNGTWKVQMDYSGLNKACAKDMYPLPEEGEELASLMGYPYKCFLQLPKEYSQIRMAEEDEEKTGFHMEEGVYCFTHMPKELKNSAATLQRMMEKVFTDKIGRNVEIYLE
ncbi:reverse transcriptase domain-containing protein [Tanacetum coccineum]